MKAKINFIIKIIGILLAISIVTVIIALFSREEITKIATTEVIAKDSLSDIDVSQEQELEGYKKTEELTDEDISDEYQKNYQKTEGEDGSYLIKTAEWTNKEEGEAQITIKGIQNEETVTSCLYVATLCYRHGLTQDIVVKNISTLTNYYDTVDFIGIKGREETGIAEKMTFTSEDGEDKIKEKVNNLNLVDNDYPKGQNTPHYIYSIVPAIEKYLFDNMGDGYVNEENLIKDPTAIYVSCDTFYYDEGTEESIWGIQYATETYFNFISDRYNGRYFSMSQTSQQDDNPKLTFRYSFTRRNEYREDLMNATIGILNPENYGEADKVISSENLEEWKNSSSDPLSYSFADKKYAAQYNYSTDFASAGVKIILGLMVSDKVSDYYEITDATATSGDNEIEVNIDGQTVTVNDDDYIAGDEIEIKINVKLKEDVVAIFDGFTDTNVGNANLVGRRTYINS